jgi:hypothetical protein
VTENHTNGGPARATRRRSSPAHAVIRGGLVAARQWRKCSYVSRCGVHDEYVHLPLRSAGNRPATFGVASAGTVTLPPAAAGPRRVRPLATGLQGPAPRPGVASVMSYPVCGVGLHRAAARGGGGKVRRWLRHAPSRRTRRARGASCGTHRDHVPRTWAVGKKRVTSRHIWMPVGPRPVLHALAVRADPELVVRRDATLGTEGTIRFVERW